MAQVRSQNIVGRWCPSAGATGFRLIDRSGRGNHGTLAGMDPASDWVVSGGKGALDFDGSNDYVSLPKVSSQSAPTSLQVGPTGFPGTWSIWVYRRASGGAAYFCENGFYCFNFSTTSATIGVWGFDRTLTGLSLDRWEHISLTYNGSNTIAAYLNGSLQGTTTGSSAAGFSSMFNFSLGARTATGSFLNGLVDDFIIWNCSLTEADMREVFRCGRGYGIGPSAHRSRRAAAAGTNRRRRIICGGSC